MTKKELLEENENLRTALSEIRDQIDDLIEEDEEEEEEEED